MLIKWDLLPNLLAHHFNYILALFGQQWKTEVKQEEEPNCQTFLWWTDYYSYKQPGKSK